MKIKKYFFIVSLALLTIFGSVLFVYDNHRAGIAEISADKLRLDDQEATIMAIKKVMPAVVNIIVMDKQTTTVINLNTGEQTKKTETVQKGSGTGFLISSDGLILTNKHVVSAGNEKTAEFRIILNTGKQYYAQLIGKDPINDLAVLKIFDKNLPYAQFGDSDKLQIGSTAIAIGNALGRYQNSATKGIVSGLGRIIEASDQAGTISEVLDNVIQTDAEINPGNSGGPLVDLNGNIIGINVAIDQNGSSIGFAIPINDARPVIKSVREIGRIVRPMLGIRYVMLTPEIAQTNKLPLNTGAFILSGEDGATSVLPNSPASKAGIKPGDIITEINAVKLQDITTLISVVQKYKPGDRIGLKVFRNGKFLVLTAVLDEFK